MRLALKGLAWILGYSITVKAFILLFLILCTNAHANTRDGLLGWWTMNELSGNLVDSSKSGNTGTVTGTSVRKNCAENNCRFFNGSTDYAATATNPLSGLGTFSISFWLNPATTVGTTVGVVQYWITSDLQILIRGNNGALQFFTFTSAQAGGDITTYSANQWTHFVMTYDGTTMRAYKNTALSATTYAQSGSVRTSSVNTLRIGGNSATSPSEYNMNGLIDDVRIYNRVLTTQEISDLFNSGIILKGNNTKLNY